MKKIIILVIFVLMFASCKSVNSTKELYGLKDLQVDRLIEILESCLPNNVERIERIDGEVSPFHYPVGIGTCVRYKDRNGRVIKPHDAFFVIWFMRKTDYNPKEIDINRVGQAFPAVFVGENKYVKVYIWGGWVESGQNGFEYENVSQKMGLVNVR